MVQLIIWPNVKETGISKIQGLGFDSLVVCGQNQPSIPFHAASVHLANGYLVKPKI